MNKRGESILVQGLIHLILIGMIVATFLFINTRILDPELALEKKLVLDSVLVKDSILAYSGKTEIKYKIRENNAVIVEEPCKIKIKNSKTTAEFTNNCFKSHIPTTTEKGEKLIVMKNG